jgi:hypothetical protein
MEGWKDGRIEHRKLRTSTALNDYLYFPDVAQVFRLERTVTHIKSQKVTHEIVVGVTSRGPDQASPTHLLLRLVRGPWTIEKNVHWVPGTAWREDASKVRGLAHHPESWPAYGMPSWACWLLKAKRKSPKVCGGWHGTRAARSPCPTDNLAGDFIP